MQQCLRDSAIDQVVPRIPAYKQFPAARKLVVSRHKGNKLKFLNRQEDMQERTWERSFHTIVCAQQTRTFNYWYGHAYAN